MTYKTTTIQIAHKVSEQFATVIFDNGKRRENICDLLDGKVKAPKDVVQFAKGWLGV